MEFNNLSSRNHENFITLSSKANLFTLMLSGLKFFKSTRALKSDFSKKKKK